jgi:cell division protein FtsA
MLHIGHEKVLGPLASAEAVLKPEDKSKGAVVVDFGAETTSVCVYKGNILRYMAILPFGGRSITMDLGQMNLDEDEAENLKLEKGTAIHYTEQVDPEEQKAFLETLSESDKLANDIIVARIEEIVDNIYAQISYSGIEPQKLTEGIIITGGASQLPGIEILLEKRTQMSVRVGNPAQNIAVVADGIELTPKDSLCVGLLLLGNENCCAILESKAKPMEKQDFVQEQTLGGGFDDSQIPHHEETSTKTQKPPKTPKPPKKAKGFSIFSKLFDDEDL